MARADDPAYLMAMFLDQALVAGTPATGLEPIDALWLNDAWATVPA